MSNEVYANGNAIACKGGDGKAIAAMPDVCLSPPSPPAGPVPIPYPNSSFSKDTQQGSKTVVIDGKEVMLKDQSFYKTSPLGNEAATNSFGGCVITHVITGKTYFNAWSMDVSFEGANVDRHLDLTTSNHASYPGSAPMGDMEKLALSNLKQDKCPCCGKTSPDCPAALSKDLPTSTQSPTPVREPLSHEEYYRLDQPALPATDPQAGTNRDPEYRRQYLAARPCQGGDCPNNGKNPRKSEAPCDVYRVTTTAEAKELTKNSHVDKEFHRDNFNPKVPRAKGVIDAFFKSNPSGTIMGMDKATWDAKLTINAKGNVDTSAQDKMVKVDHVTPRAAGGCPNSTKNTQSHGYKCANCKAVDNETDTWSGLEQGDRRTALGIT